jgi:hypothetical protein
MSIVTDAQGRIRPYRENEFNARAPIVDEGPSPGLTGTLGIVSNQATLWAQSGHMVISDKMYRTEDLSLTWGANIPVYFGSWSFQIPKWMNATSGTWRRFLTFIVDTDLGATPTIIMSAHTSLGTTPGARTSYGGRWVTQFDVPLPASAALPNDATWFTVTLSAEWDGGAGSTFTVYGVVAYVERVLGTLDPDANSSGVIDLVDDKQIKYQEALDVHSVRALLATNEVLFASNMRPVVTSGWWPQGTDDPLDSVPLEPVISLSDDLTDSEVNPYWEWLYFPRQGVKRLRIGIAAVRLGADNRELYIGFRDVDAEETVVVTVAATSNDPTYWQHDGDLFLDVPSSAGPLYLRIGLVADESTFDGVGLMKVMIHEEVLKGNNLT